MQNEHLRPAFEVWAADYFTHPDKSKAISLSCGAEVIRKDGDGNYFWPEIQDAWETWQAAHQATVPSFEPDKWTIDQILQDIGEMPDRSSPIDYPDHFVLTPNELEQILQWHLIDYPAELKAEQEKIKVQNDA